MNEKIKALIEKVYEIFKTLVPTKDFKEYAETLVKLRRELGIPVDKKRVFLVGGSFHGHSLHEDSVEYKWPPHRYLRHTWKVPVLVPNSDDIVFELPDDVYDFVRFTCGDCLYVYRETISYDPKDYK